MNWNDGLATIRMLQKVMASPDADDTKASAA
jgi:hypothetical protein